MTGPDAYEKAMGVCQEVRRRHAIEWELPDELQYAQVLATLALAVATAELAHHHSLPGRTCDAWAAVLT
jgi:hypothetical protein